MKAFKGFDKNLKCRDFQFEIGKEYEEKEASLCNRGFHACEYPLDTFRYYYPNESRYCEVELEDTGERHDDDTKVCGTKIKIGAEIGIPGIVKAAVEYVTERAKPSNRHHTITPRKANSATGYGSANSATGARSANSATGDWSANSATGDWSANSATGARSANSATGARSANSATGYGSANSATGYGSANLSTGIECENNGEGERNICVAWGKDNKCKGSIGSFLVLSEWGEWDGAKYPFVSATMVEVDGETIKADTWYTLRHGEIVEV